MRWDTKRYITELFIGFLVVGMVAGMLIFREYETYLHYLSIEAQLIASDDPKEEVFQILKEGETMGSDKGREILKKYGYETAADNREGVRMMKNSVWIAGGAFVVWLGFAAILYFEKRRNRQENLAQSRKVSEWLVRIREGVYRQDLMDWYEEDEVDNRLLDELESLGSYVEMVEEQAHKEKEETKTLVTDISHQLKTPVAALHSCLEILKNQDLTVEERKEFESRLERQMKSLEQLIGALVNISRLETGMIELKLTKGRAFDVLLEAINRIWEKARKKEIEIEMDAEDGLEEILILRDPKWLCESLINVLDNAVKYSPVGSTVTIRAATTVSFLRLEVKDEGIGIPRENYHKVFQRFYRGEAPLVQKEEGSGVGLYLARKIIEGHNGTISLDARRMTKEPGSVFVIQLPL